MSEKTKVELVSELFERQKRIYKEAGVDYAYNDDGVPSDKRALSMVENSNPVIRKMADDFAVMQEAYNSSSDEEKKAKDDKEIASLKDAYKNLPKEKYDRLVGRIGKSMEDSLIKGLDKKSMKENVEKAIKSEVVSYKLESFKSSAKAFACGVKAKADVMKSLVVNKIKGNHR